MSYWITAAVVSSLLGRGSVTSTSCIGYEGCADIRQYDKKELIDLDAVDFLKELVVRWASGLPMDGKLDWLTKELVEFDIDDTRGVFIKEGQAYVFWWDPTCGMFENHCWYRHRDRLLNEKHKEMLRNKL